MYFGHFAVSLLLVALEQRADPLFVVAGAGWIDLIHGLFVITGVSVISPNPAALP